MFLFTKDLRGHLQLDFTRNHTDMVDQIMIFSYYLERRKNEKKGF